MKSSSGVSSDLSENKRSSFSYEPTDSVELRIIEESDEEPSPTHQEKATLLQLNNHQAFILGRQESRQSISVILDNIV